MKLISYICLYLNISTYQYINNMMTNTDKFVGVVRTYYDKKETKLKEEYFMNAGKKKVLINHIIKMDN